MATCYMLRRNKGSTLLITPFVDPKLAGDWKEDEAVTWFASTGLTANEKDEALLTLYTQIDRGVDRWIQDKRYIPRLLLSAVAFLLTYFFFSLAVRDPLPMIDELAIAAGAAILVGISFGKRDKKSELAMKRRLELKQNASRSDFEILEGLGVYESYLDTCSVLDTLDLADRLALSGEEELPPLELDEEADARHEQFRALLLRHFEITDRPFFDRYTRVMNVHKSGIADESLGARLVRLAMHQDIDLPLLALLVAVSKH